MVIIVELAVALRVQQDQFRVALEHVEQIHHQQTGPAENSNHQAALSSHAQRAGRSDDARRHVAQDDEPPKFALLDNDMGIMSKVAEMFKRYGYQQVHPWQDHIGKWEVKRKKVLCLALFLNGGVCCVF